MSTLNSSVAPKDADGVDEKQAIQMLKDEIAHLEKANYALQEIVDALGSLPDLGEFVPAALRIVARVFEAKDCAYYEHRRGELVRLRYWFFDGRVLGPEEIRTLPDDHQYSDMKRLEAGFEVPDSYLGVPCRLRTIASVVDHDRASGVDPSWDALCMSRGWYKELSVPLVVAGEADGALVIQRGYGTTYLPSEITLAERLAKQLALAMEVDRLSGVARQTAVVHERQLTAQQRADELSLYTEALKQTIDSLAGEEDLHGFIGRVLTIAAEQLKAPIVEYWIGEGATKTKLVLTCRDGVIYEGSDDPDDPRVRGVEVPTDLARGDELSRQVDSVVYDMLENRVFRDHAEGFGMKVEAWCRERGVQKMMVIPLLRSERSYGVLCICLPKDRRLDQAQVDLARSLAQQVSLAVRMTELADSSRRAALSQEREKAAYERAAEFFKANEVLRSTVDRLSDEQDLHAFPATILREAMKQIKAGDGILLVFDATTQTLQMTEHFVTSDVATAELRDFLKLFPVDNKPIAVNATPLWSTAIAAHCPIVFDIEADSNMLLPGATEWHRKQGNKSVVIAPMFINAQPYGFFGFALREDKSGVSDDQLGLIHALTQQATLAIQLARLADESKQSALTQQKEQAAQQRSAELSKANRVLRSTLEQLSDERNLESFPKTILKEAMQQLDAKDGIIFVFDKSFGTLQATEYLASPGWPAAPTDAFARPFSAASVAAWDALLAKREPIVFDVERDESLLLPGESAWHRSRGNRCVIMSPIFVGGEPYGFFGTALEAPAEDISDVDLELMQALTHQAALAIQLTRLADESKQAALAQERERDAEERAAEFANANEVLRSTLDQLAAEQDLHSFPRTILKEAMNQAEARDGLILIFDEQRDTLTRSEYLAGEKLPPASTAEFSMPFSASATPAWAALIEKRSPIIFDVEQDAAMLLPGLADWHRKRGNRSIIAAAMFIDSKPYGYFGITLAETAANVSKVKAGLIYALAQQATLAIQLTRLAETSKQAAIQLERQEVVVQERANMAREIHDRLAQGYAAILMQQHAMRRSLQRNDFDLSPEKTFTEHLDIIERLSKDNLAEARRTMDELRIDPFGAGDLAHVLRECVGKISRETSFQVSLRIDEDLPSLRRYVETELCRVVSEALTNAEKHARVRSARVDAKRVGGEISITIEDDGVGFAVQGVGPSFGISSMYERAARAGAEIKILSTPGAGTKITITVPR